MDIYFIGPKELLLSSSITEATIEDCIKYCENKDILAIDTETTGIDWNKEKIIMLQIGDKDRQFVIDTRFVNIDPLKHILETKLIIGQNIKFDYKFLLNNNIRLKNVWDTMLAECVLKCGKKKVGYGLNILCERYLKISLKKDIRSQFSQITNGQPFTETQIIYGAKDILYLEEIRNKQLVLIQQLNLEKILDLENNATLAFAEIEYNGMGFDVDKWLDLANIAYISYTEKEKELDNLILSDIMLDRFVLPGIQLDLFGKKPKKTKVLWSSPSQVKQVLQVLDPTLENTNMRELFKRQNKFPLIKTLIDYRKQSKLITTYGKDFVKHFNKKSQRVHTLFWQILNTGRVSSGSTRTKNNPHQAPNMQNIPANNDYRNCFKAEDNWKIVTMDYSGQELRLIAEGSQEPMWLNAFNNGEDVHGKVASLVFSIDIEKVKDKPTFLNGKSYRDVAKTVNFGLAYGMSYMKLADTLSIPQEDAKEYINKYFEQLPKIKLFLNALGNYGKKHGHIKTFKPFRRIRWFEDHSSLSIMPIKDKMIRLGEIERASKNTPIQGSGADMIKQALVLIVNYINKHNLHNKVKIISQVHDEISCEVINTFVDSWIKIQEKLMLEAGEVICKSVKMPVDYTVTDRWSK